MNYLSCTPTISDSYILLTFKCFPMHHENHVTNFNLCIYNCIYSLQFSLTSSAFHMESIAESSRVSSEYVSISCKNASRASSQHRTVQKNSSELCITYVKAIHHIQGKGTSRQRSGKGALRKRFPLQKPRWEKTKLTIRYLYHETIVSRMGSYFPNRWPLSYLNLTKNMKTYIRRQQHKKFLNTKT